ncbi:hypothetical protein ACH4KN_27040 [Streptomyces sp. NPDC017546]|uniref:hypothetical protein n=1 Tax=unclassified Streptomyces TaxID=2593676 RepID=UPI0023612847|nr:hypothetical protein [Streptomyces sp. MMBL 11-1]
MTPAGARPQRVRVSGTDDGTQLLDYDVYTAPNPLDASEKSGAARIGSVSVKVSLAAGTPVVCKQLTFTFPVGDKDTDLIPENHIRVIHPGYPGTWTIRPTKTYGCFLAKPKNTSYGTISAGDIPLEFTFPNVEINSAHGTATLAIEEVVNDVTNRPPLFALPKVPAGIEFRDFRPDESSVHAGAEIHLSWRAQLPKGHQVYLLWSGHQENVTGRNSYDVHIYRTTVFQLWDCPPETPSTPHLIQQTVATVCHPWLWAGNLTVGGPADILQPDPAPHSPHADDTPPLELLQSEMYGSTVSRTYTAETDGLLTGTLRSCTDSADGTLAIDVTPPHSKLGHHYKIRCHGAGHKDPRKPGDNLEALVLADSTVRITWTLTDNKRTTDKEGGIPDSFLTSLHWRPWGIGSLTPTS